jgi:uncharacterized phiE125 gp8 family phage protein
MRSILRLVTPPTERAVSLNEARRHLRIEDTDQDDLIRAYIEAAEQSLSYVGRAFKPASYALDIYGWAGTHIELPMPPLRSVTAVKAPGTNGTLATVDPSNYTVATTSEGRGVLLTSTAYVWPPYSSGWVSASVEFTAGYDTVPSNLRAAILLVAGTLFENRSGASPVPMTKLPYGIDALVGPLRDLTM